MTTGMILDKAVDYTFELAEVPWTPVFHFCVAIRRNKGSAVESVSELLDRLQEVVGLRERLTWLEINRLQDIQAPDEIKSFSELTRPENECLLRSLIEKRPIRSFS